MLEEKKFFIAGVQHHEMHTIIKELEVGDILELVPEYDNKYDPNAVKIIYGETMLGYVPRKFSAEISAAFEVGAELDCTIVTLNPDGKPWEWCEVVIQETTIEEDSLICPTCSKDIELCECKEVEG